MADGPDELSDQVARWGRTILQEPPRSWALFEPDTVVVVMGEGDVATEGLAVLRRYGPVAAGTAWATSV